jgi:prophage antirepressor-like protein
MRDIEIIFKGEKVRCFVINEMPYFSVFDVCKVLGITNSRDATASLEKDDVGITDGIDSLGRKQELVIINEGALYQLIFKSRKKEAKDFRRWLTHEVLPTLRQTGKYQIAKNNSFTKNMNEKYQIENSKKINAKNYIEGGVEKIIQYNTENCKVHAGKIPSEIKKEGLEKGLKKSDCNSAKAVLRKLNPEIACSMSFADSLVELGYDLNTISPITKEAINIYDKLIKIGFKPVELLNKD